METIDIVEAVAEPLADTNYKGIFAGLALAGALVAGGVAWKKYRGRKAQPELTVVSTTDTDQ